MEHKPQWMIDHEAQDLRQFAEIKAMLKDQNIAIKPMIDTYNKSLTIWDFFSVTGKLIIQMGLVLGTIMGIVTFINSHKI